MMSSAQSITLSQLNRRIVDRITCDTSLQHVWVTAETTAVRIAGAHCYLELVEKDPETGRQLARNRATIWASTYYHIIGKFTQETGQVFKDDIKVMVLVSATYHPVYGLSLNIHDINSAYTLGDVMRRRNEILARLVQDGILEANRRLPWPTVPQRIAVISAPGAAGYGDFINQLYTNAARLRFTSRLYSATMQGERTVPTVLAALDQIASESEQWDCVVIIRGGGSPTDLLWFDDYQLAAHIAQFPIPVIIGIGHERDITVLDYVANMRVKTPTAAAEWLISRGEQALGALQSLASNLLHAVSDRLSGCHQQLSYIAGQLPASTTNAIAQSRNRLDNARVVLSSVADRRLRPEAMRLDSYSSALSQAVTVTLERAATRLDTASRLLDVVSPQATLRRGFSITRIGGRTVSHVTEVAPDMEIVTTLADGTLLSRVIHADKSSQT